MAIIDLRLREGGMTEEDRRFYQQLGQRIAVLRREHHFTQVELAKLLGISQQLMASYEAGRRKIPTSALPALSRLLSTDPESLLGMATSQRRGPASRLQRQLEQIGALPRTKQRFVIDMIQTVIQQS